MNTVDVQMFATSNWSQQCSKRTETVATF